MALGAVNADSHGTVHLVRRAGMVAVWAGGRVEGVSLWGEVCDFDVKGCAYVDGVLGLSRSVLVLVT